MLDTSCCQPNISLNLRIRPAPVYLSTDKRMRGINTHPSDNPKKQQPIYDLMSLYNTNPISSSTQAQSEQQGGGSGHIDNQWRLMTH